MTDDEMKLDMLVAELDYENRLLRARNERLEKELKEAVLAEREACARLCDAEWSTFEEKRHGNELADSIRARGQE